jgi:magnesium-protoporphyrin O-methyltransferase
MNRSVLDVGCGVGGVHIALLEQGAQSVQAVDVSEGMIEQARLLAQKAGVRERIQYFTGDIVQQNVDVKSADIVVMDKVLCCYHDVNVLLRTVLGRVRWVLAVSYPGDTWIPTTIFKFMDWLGQVRRWSFHPYYHDPDMIDAILKEGGLKEVASERTWIWQIRTFVRNDT